MGRRDQILAVIEQTGPIASSKDLIGIAGIMHTSELHSLLYSLQKSGKIKFKERHNGKSSKILADIHVLAKKEDGPVVVSFPEEPAKPEQEASAPPEEGKKIGTTDRIREWISKQKTDVHGWVEVSPGLVAGHINIEPGYVSTYLNNLERQGEVELLRVPEGKRNRIIGVRTVDAAHAERDEKIKAFKKDLWLEVPPTPMLDEYEAARDLAAANPWLSFNPEPIYEEAANIKKHLVQCIEQSKESK